MKLIKGFIWGVAILFTVSLFFSCNLDDFNFKKLADTNDVVPEVFAPLAYGTFTVDDLVVSGSLSDNFPIPSTGLELDSVIVNKTGKSFRSTAIDSVYLVTHFTNNMPVDIEFNLSFIDTLTGNPLGKVFLSGVIPAGSTDQKILFSLGSVDQDNLAKASGISLNFKLSSPDATNPILYKAVKLKTFTLKISFYAPLNIQRL